MLGGGTCSRLRTVVPTRSVSTCFGHLDSSALCTNTSTFTSLSSSGGARRTGLRILIASSGNTHFLLPIGVEGDGESLPLLMSWGRCAATSMKDVSGSIETLRVKLSSEPYTKEVDRECERETTVSSYFRKPTAVSGCAGRGSVSVFEPQRRLLRTTGAVVRGTVLRGTDTKEAGCKEAERVAPPPTLVDFWAFDITVDPTLPAYGRWAREPP